MTEIDRIAALKSIDHNLLMAIARVSTFMFIDPFVKQSNDSVNFTRQQSSDFAKNIANDFNPIHNIDAKRFCVPGDLLFALVLARYGISQNMAFNFAGMVTEHTQLVLPAESDKLMLTDSADKLYMQVERSGECTLDEALIAQLTQAYVLFSGRTFPSILMPLLEDKGVMINPKRPMVMYQDMMIEMQDLNQRDISLEFDAANTRITVEGKRGKVALAFHLKAGENIVGRGEKHMVLSGLMPYEAEAAVSLETEYDSWKQAYLAETA